MKKRNFLLFLLANLALSLQTTRADNDSFNVQFTGNVDANNPTLLALSDNGKGTPGRMATGLGVELLDSNRTPIPINNTESSLYPLLPGDNTLTFYLHYKSTLPVVTSGNATAVMYFDLLYQ